MTLFQWFVLFLIVQIIHFLGTWKMYEAAGRKSWEAGIPIYNAIVLMKIINRPTWWTFLLFVPVINLIMFPIVWIETLRSFGKNSALDTFLAIATLGFYVYYVNYTQPLQYITDRSLTPTTKIGDTIGSIAFAVIVATLVHTYVMQPFQIPSSSLEKSLLVGDFLFVSKLNYGPRVPMTEVALPMVHDSIPLMHRLSYLPKPQVPYFRFPGFEKIKNNDIVVFNWPRDTLDHMYHPSPIRVDKPKDKKTNYVKRCVGIPGDSLQIKNGIVFINGKELKFPERAKPQYSYTVGYDGKTPIDFEYVLKEYDITDGAGFTSDKRDSLIFRALTFENAERLRNIPGITSVNRNIKKGAEDGIFPDFQDGKPSISNTWNADNFGPIYIPQAGKTVALNKKTLPYYKIIINDYENNKLNVVGNDIYVNDKIVTTYTFKQDYYWMMGDNRHNSLDARYFGYTPEDHIVGKPVFIWLSLDSNAKGLDKIRWSRMFTFVSGEGQPNSYFKYFLVLLALYFVGEYFWKKRKETKD
jgi:signal peptidase I